MIRIRKSAFFVWVLLVSTFTAHARQVVIIEHVAFPEIAGGASRAKIAEIQEQLVPAWERAGGLKVLYRFQTIPFVIAETEAAGLQRLKSAPEVIGVAEDETVQPLTAQSTSAIGADYVFQTYNRNGAGVAVGIIDSGLDLTHPDLSGAMIAGRRQLGADIGTDVQDDYGHGSYIAGIVTSDGNLAPQGIAPGAGIVMVKATNSQGVFQLSDIAAGIDWIVANHASFPSLKFINLSFGGAAPSSCPCNNIGQSGSNADAYTVLRAAINAAESAGILCIAAAGNNGYGSNPSPPACFPNVISVGASYDTFFSRAPASGFYSDLSQPGNALPVCADQDAQVNSIACFTSRAGCLDFIAPGYLITSCDLMARSGVISTFGTSAAAAHVTAALALLQQINPSLSAQELVELLRSTAVPTVDPDPDSGGVTYDRIDVREAARVLLSAGAPHWSIFQ